MGVKVKGVREAKENLNRLIGDIQGRKAVRAIQSALLLIGQEAAMRTPVATSTLINSQFRELSVIGSRLIGKVGYSVNYAAAVHAASGKLKGQPRPRKDGVAQGNYWDPRGEPRFLDSGADAARDAVDAIIKKEMQL
uniref:HK97 gp10 family phage protein n=1 Tax=Serratia quinivorans TaxID=137545 RepID=UPI0035C67E59